MSFLEMTRFGALSNLLSQDHTHYPVTRRDDKTVTLIIKGKESRVSIDRVKPAYLMANEIPAVKTQVPQELPGPAAPQVQPAPPSKAEVKIPKPVGETPKPANEESYKTRSGRRVQFRFPPSTLVGK